MGDFYYFSPTDSREEPKDLIETGRKKEAINQVLREVVFMRVFSPSSKLRSCSLIEKFFSKQISHKQVLTMMDRVFKEEDVLRQKVFESLASKGSDFNVLLFDVTTLYFESTMQGELRDFGYSKDGKFNETQVVLAVLANTEGLPLAYEVFPGCTSETKTLQFVLNQAVKKYKVKRIRVVADRAMFSDSNFKFFESLNKKGIEAEYVVSCPLKKLPKEKKEKIFEFKELKKESQNSEVYEFSYKNRKVFVSYSEKRRLQDEKKRQRLLEKLKKICKDGKISATKLVSNRGVRKYLKTLKGSVQIDADKIFQDSLWDGLYGVCSNIECETNRKPLELYRSLWKIEELFRINKHTLKMRPIYHRLSERIKSHLFICFLAYTVLKYVELSLKKATLHYSLNELIDTLKEVESFVIGDKMKKPSVSYFVPRALSKEAKQIYAVFKKDYIKKPFRIENSS